MRSFSNLLILIIFMTFSKINSNIISDYQHYKTLDSIRNHRIKNFQLVDQVRVWKTNNNTISHFEDKGPLIILNTPGCDHNRLFDNSLRINAEQKLNGNYQGWVNRAYMDFNFIDMNFDNSNVVFLMCHPVDRVLNVFKNGIGKGGNIFQVQIL